MVGKLVRSEVSQQLLSDLVWKLYHSVKFSSLTSGFQQIESRKARKTLRSAERAPTLFAEVQLSAYSFEFSFLNVKSFIVFTGKIVHRGSPRRGFIPQEERFETHPLPLI